MTKINKTWHLAHKMPKNPTHDQRMMWHIEHNKHCHCYPISPKLLKELEEFKKIKKLKKIKVTQ